MSELSELNKAINALNDLWPLLEGEEKNKLINERNRLKDISSALAHKTLVEGVPELNDAIEILEKVTVSAKDAKDSIVQVAEGINKVADTVENCVLAVKRLTDLIDVL